MINIRINCIAYVKKSKFMHSFEKKSYFFIANLLKDGYSLNKVKLTISWNVTLS